MLATAPPIMATYSPRADTYAAGRLRRCSVVDRKRVLRSSRHLQVDGIMLGGGKGQLFFLTQLPFSFFSYLFSTALQATRWARSSSPYCSSAELKASL